VREPGGPEVLEERDVPTPTPGPGEIRIKVAATAVNRADLIQRLGAYPAPKDSPQDILGLEYAGTVDACGEHANRFRVGERVFGIAGGGTYAEYVTVHEGTASPIPDGVSFTDAAAFPEGFTTAYDAMVSQGRLAKGERVLIHAVGSGVGTCAVQIAAHLGAISIGTARTAEKLERAKQIGLTHSILVTSATFADEVNRLTAGKGFDVALDLVGGGYLPEEIACAASRARILLVGLLAGRQAEVDLGAILRKRIELRGTVLRSRTLSEKKELGTLLEKDLSPLLAKGTLRPSIDRVMPLSEARAAHIQMSQNEGFGKIVLTI